MGAQFHAEVCWEHIDVLRFQPRKLATLATCGPLKLCKYYREFWGDNHMISTWIKQRIWTDAKICSRKEYYLLQGR